MISDQTRPSTEEHPDQALVEMLRDRLVDSIREALGGAREVALVNFHSLATGWPRWVGNPGDMAIWLGARAVLRRLGVNVVYQCAYNTLSLPALRRALPFGPILITGGGDFGDLYAFGTPETRERLLAALRGVRIIQLPIAVYFRETANINRIQRLISEHNNFTLMVRDSLSEERARNALDADIRLVPDMAFGLGHLRRNVTPDVDVVWNTWQASDTEYVDHGEPPVTATSRLIEWASKVPNEPPWPISRRIARRFHIHAGRWMYRWPGLRTPLWRGYAATLSPLCQGCMSRGLHLLSSGKVVVTNKLHAHIFATLAGIPHVVMDNSFGKVSGLYSTWTSDSNSAHWAADGDEARQIALRLLKE